MLEGVTELFRRLDEAGIRYCHWKSNDRLAEALDGCGDLDLLVASAQRPRFEAVVARLDYRLGRRPRWSETPDVAHFYGLDASSGALIHLHVYFELVTGGSVLKNHCLPFAPLALANREPGGSVPTPRRDIDLAMFVLRKMIEFGKIIEATMVLREGRALRRELAWLAEGSNLERAARLVADVLPEIDPPFFLRCGTALARGSLTEKFWLGLVMNRRLARFARVGRPRAALQRGYRLAARIGHRLFSRRHPSTLAQGGAIIAVVGPDATGKSTIVDDLAAWLGAEFWVEGVHAGRPPATWLTCVPQWLLPLLRRVAPSFRTSAMAFRGAEMPGDRAPAKGLRVWTWVVRALMIAHDRRALLRRLDRLRAQGAIVVCDRYPSIAPGTMDGAQLWGDAADATAAGLFRRLATLERDTYASLPAPNLVVRLTVPVEVAIARNIRRLKPSKESEDYLRQRHDRARQPAYRMAAEVTVDTSGALHDTVLAAKIAVWQHLAHSHAAGASTTTSELAVNSAADAAVTCVQQTGGA